MPTLVFGNTINETAVLRAFIIEEEQTRDLSVWMRVFFVLDVRARRAALVRQNHADGPVRLDNINAMHRDLIKRSSSVLLRRRRKEQ
jgi:hypothetical protein